MKTFFTLLSLPVVAFLFWGSALFVLGTAPCAARSLSTEEPPQASLVAASLLRWHDGMLSEARPDGSFRYDVEMGPGGLADYLLTAVFVSDVVHLETLPMQRLVDTLVAYQNSDGSFGLVPGGRGHFGVSLTTALALKICGVALKYPQVDAVVRVEAWLRAQDPRSYIGLVYRYPLAMFGQYPLRGILMGPAIFYDKAFDLLERVLSIGSIMASANTLIALLPDGYSLPAILGVAGALSRELGVADAFDAQHTPIDLRELNDSPLFNLPRDAINRIHEKLLFRYNAFTPSMASLVDKLFSSRDSFGGWAGYSLITASAIKGMMVARNWLRRYQRNPELQQRLEAGIVNGMGAMRLLWHDMPGKNGSRLVLRAARMHVTETAMSIGEIARSARVLSQHIPGEFAQRETATRVVLGKGVIFLEALQTKPNDEGIWRKSAIDPQTPYRAWVWDGQKGKMSGDIDDTCTVLLYLHEVKAYAEQYGDVTSAAAVDAIHARTIPWVETMQSSNGGFGSFGRNQFALFGKDHYSDAPVSEVSNRCIVALGDRVSAHRAATFVLSEWLRKDGQVKSHWFLPFSYGTAASASALPALQSLVGDVYPQGNFYEQGLEQRFLKHVGNDGGWGERNDADDVFHDWKDMDRSSTADTAYLGGALLLLTKNPFHPEVLSALRLVLQRQPASGLWDEPEHWTGIMLPGQVHIRYQIMERTMPAKFLSLWLEMQGGKQALLPTEDKIFTRAQFLKIAEHVGMSAASLKNIREAVAGETKTFLFPNERDCYRFTNAVFLASQGKHVHLDFGFNAVRACKPQGHKSVFWGTAVRVP